MSSNLFVTFSFQLRTKKWAIFTLDMHLELRASLRTTHRGYSLYTCRVTDVQLTRDGLVSADWFYKFWRSLVKIKLLCQRWMGEQAGRIVIFKDGWLFSSANVQCGYWKDVWRVRGSDCIGGLWFKKHIKRGHYFLVGFLDWRIGTLMRTRISDKKGKHQSNLQTSAWSRKSCRLQRWAKQFKITRMNKYLSSRSCRKTCSSGPHEVFNEILMQLKLQY